MFNREVFSRKGKGQVQALPQQRVPGSEAGRLRAAGVLNVHLDLVGPALGADRSDDVVPVRLGEIANQLRVVVAQEKRNERRHLQHRQVLPGALIPPLAEGDKGVVGVFLLVELALRVQPPERVESVGISEDVGVVVGRVTREDKQRLRGNLVTLTGREGHFKLLSHVTDRQVRNVHPQNLVEHCPGERKTVVVRHVEVVFTPGTQVRPDSFLPYKLNPLRVLQNVCEAPKRHREGVRLGGPEQRDHELRLVLRGHPLGEDAQASGGGGAGGGSNPVERVLKHASDLTMVFPVLLRLRQPERGPGDLIVESEEVVLSLCRHHPVPEHRRVDPRESVTREVHEVGRAAGAQFADPLVHVLSDLVVQAPADGGVQHLLPQLVEPCALVLDHVLWDPEPRVPDFVHVHLDRIAHVLHPRVIVLLPELIRSEDDGVCLDVGQNSHLASRRQRVCHQPPVLLAVRQHARVGGEQLLRRLHLPVTHHGGVLRGRVSGHCFAKVLVGVTRKQTKKYRNC
eukprot:Hpha_TRINITY_DN10816_c0_g1::TRINITY_DN10816_c0_g1_i1::g.23368::m.23368